MSKKLDLGKVDWVKDVCGQVNFMLVESKNKLYALGGYSLLTDTTFVTDNYLKIIDFSSGSIDVSSDKITTTWRISPYISLVKWANLFVNDGKLRLFGGQYEFYQALNEDGANSTTRQPPIANRIYTYDIAADKWLDQVEESGFGEQQTIGRAAITQDSRGVGWLYGGTAESGEYVLGNEKVGANARFSSDLRALVKVEAGKRPQKVLEQSPVMAAEQAEMVFIDGVGKEGVLVVFAGRANAGLTSPTTFSQKSLKSVDIYDIATNTWYSQSTTAEKGNYPPDRQESCSVIVSAPDGSSHNIYMYSGFEPGNSPYKDVWVLSIPAFHWVSVGTGLELPRANHKCAKVQEKYMISYRGKPAERCDTDSGIQVFDMSTLQWTTKITANGKQTYTVPGTLYKIIGGDGDGKANLTSPRSG